MAQTGYTPIQLYYSTTAAAQPLAANLAAGELAINTLDEKLYFKNSAGTVKLLASSAGAAGSVTSVAMTVPAFLSVSGSPITSSGTLALSLSGTALPVANGGTGQTSYVNGELLIGNTTGNTLTKATLTAGSGVSITNGAGSITIAATGSGGTVTSVAQSFTGGLISVSGSPITGSGTLALTVAGTSGGIPYFSGASTWASSAALAANALVIGGGAGAAPSTTTTGTGVLTALGNAVNATGGVVTVNGTATLTNKTLTSPVISTISNTGTLTLPTSTDTLVGRATTDTLTNKTLTDPAIIGTIIEDVFTITDGVAFEVDPGNGSIQLITLGASRTPKATNFVAGEAVTMMIDDGAGYTITWTDATWGGSGVVWKTNGGVAPTLNTTGYTVIVLWKVGTQVYGARVGDA